ncbi:MAG: dUTP diphosphatase [Firmicutes bacterium]|nr:dUTP diphosphatase [Bacillota bacterium]
MIIRIKSASGNIPSYETEGSAGADIRARLEEPITMMPGERRLISTGMYVELPEGVEAQIRARSGLSIKHGITMINGVGTVDSDYRGEWNVPMVNLGQEPYTIHDGDRIAQAVFARFQQADFVLVEEVNETERGGGGFGSTGV